MKYFYIFTRLLLIFLNFSPYDCLILLNRKIARSSIRTNSYSLSIINSPEIQFVKSFFHLRSFEEYNFPVSFKNFYFPWDLSISPTYVQYSIAFLLFCGILLGNTRKSDTNDSISILGSEPYGKYGDYDPLVAESYFSNRPLLVLGRFSEITLTALSFGVKLLSDIVLNRNGDPKIESERAEELAVLLTNLGPTYIKVGQSLSIRSDLLSPAYLLSLSKLQDKVPPFPTKMARELIAQEFGRNPEDIFASGLEPTSEVVAAASLGQVYKARLRSDASEVAVKIQRPDILERVALDMHISRQLAAPIKDAFKIQSDLVGLVDDWGRGFVDELNYEKEASNAQIFTEYIERTPLRSRVFAPELVLPASTRRILTTKWVEGEKLDKAKGSDIVQLCSLAMNTYLTMMLECPILHCDPHPGNLKRTDDGRLCILDWGLVTRLSPSLQQDFIEHIAHLTSKDYSEVPQDLVRLGFVPEGMEEVALKEGVVEVLTSVYMKLAGGGGAAKIDVNSVVSEMKGLADNYGNVFQLPPYFAYVGKAFGVLEGIGLSVDPDYSIVSECLPYISQRLLTDSSDRAGSALNTFIYGSEKHKPHRVIDSDRLDMLLQGFSKYSSTLTDEQLKGSASPSPSLALAFTGNTNSASSVQIDEMARQFVDLIVAGEFPSLLPSKPESSLPVDSKPSRGQQLTPLQMLVIEEIAKVLGATLRSTFGSIRRRSGRLGTGRTLLGLALDPLGLFRESALVNPDETDERVLSSVKKIADLVRVDVAAQELLRSINSNDARKLFVAIVSRLWERRANIPLLTAYLVKTLLQQTAIRLERSSRLDSSSSSR